MRTWMATLGLVAACGAGDAAPPDAGPADAAPAGSPDAAGASPCPALVADGRADFGPAIAEALAAGDCVEVPAGVWPTSTVTIGPRAAVEIRGAGTLQLRPGLNGDLLVLDGVDAALLRDVTLDGNRAAQAANVDATTSDVAVLKVVSGTVRAIGLTIANAQLHGVRLDHAGGSVLQGLTVVDIGPDVGGPVNGERGGRGIDVVFSDRVLVEDSTVTHTTGAGIQFWGVYEPAPEVYIREVTARGNTVDDTGNACLWGAHMDVAVFSANVVSNCGDVGLDAESSRDVLVVGNRVTDARNGGLTVFYGAERVTFADNVVTQSAGSGPAVKLLGPAPARGVDIIRNTLTATTAEAITAVPGIWQASDITDNTITASAPDLVALRVLEGAALEIRGNTITTAAQTGIGLEGTSGSVVVDNTVTSTAVAAGGVDSGGIFVYWRSAAFPARDNLVRGNTVTGFERSINDDCWGDLDSRNRFEANVVESMFHRGGAGYTGTFDGNVAAVGGAPVAPTAY